MCSAYNYLTAVGGDIQPDTSSSLWLKVVPLKITIFSWRFLRNRLPTKDNLVRCQVLPFDDHICTGACGMNEDRWSMFVRCDFYGRLWLLIANWHVFATVSQGSFQDHLAQFGLLEGFSKHV